MMRFSSISAKFEEYVKDAKDILRIEDKSEMETNSTRLAFALLARDKDKENALLARDKDKEKELSNLRKDMEKEMALLNRKHLERDAFRKSQLMYVTQRYVIGAYCKIL